MLQGSLPKRPLTSVGAGPHANSRVHVVAVLSSSDVYQLHTRLPLTLPPTREKVNSGATLGRGEFVQLGFRGKKT